METITKFVELLKTWITPVSKVDDQTPNVEDLEQNRMWTDSEENSLLTLSKDGFSDEEIAHLLQRSKSAIYQKRRRLDSKIG